MWMGMRMSLSLYRNVQCPVWLTARRRSLDSAVGVVGKRKQSWVVRPVPFRRTFGTVFPMALDTNWYAAWQKASPAGPGIVASAAARPT